MERAGFPRETRPPLGERRDRARRASGLVTGAADRIRTGDVKLGKLAFYP